MKKVLWVLLIVLVAGNGALLLTLTPETLPTGPAPTVTPPAAQPPSAMKLAAIKAGLMVTLASNAYRGANLVEVRDFNMGGILVRHPQGNLLFDAGFGRDYAAHSKTAPLLMRMTALLRKEPTVAEQLRAAGIELATLRGVVLTHAHWDHVSGLADLPGVPVWVTQPELDYIHSGESLAQLAASLPDVKFQVYDFTGGPYLGFAKSHDVFGDGSVVMVPAPGHTPGSVIAFIATPDGKRYALIGDIAWQKEGVEIPAQRPWLPRQLADSDAAATRALLVRLHELQQALPGLVIVPAHDRRVWNSLPGLAG